LKAGSSGRKHKRGDGAVAQKHSAGFADAIKRAPTIPRAGRADQIPKLAKKWPKQQNGFRGKKSKRLGKRQGTDRPERPKSRKALLVRRAFLM
jgi:hypothetical protein